MTSKESRGSSSNSNNDCRISRARSSDAVGGGRASVASAVKVPVGEIGNVLDLIGGYLVPLSPPMSEAVAANSSTTPSANFRGGAHVH
jgi:hypothetical protein